jgi:hypothetical protein
VVWVVTSPKSHPRLFSATRAARELQINAIAPPGDRRNATSAGSFLRIQLDIEGAVDYAICKHFTPLRHFVERRVKLCERE